MWMRQIKYLMNGKTNQTLEKFGFRFGANGPHAARTMMLEDISNLLDQLPLNAESDAFERQIVESNALSKPTKKARELSLRHLSALYALDPNVLLFRTFRRLWQHDANSRKVLAIQMANSRDPLLRGTQDFILSKKPGEQVSREELLRIT